VSTLEETLAHYGVKGMHWGVRKATTSTGSVRLNRKIERATVIKAERAKRVAKLEGMLEDLTKNGAQSAPMKAKYGRILDTKSELAFYALSGKTKDRLVGEMKLDLERQIRDEKFRDQIQTRKLAELQQRQASAQAGTGQGVEHTSLGAVLEHFGVKGMHWGVRKAEKRRAVSSTDANNAADAKAKIKKAGGTHVLTNQELQSLVSRMNLEQQLNTLKEKEPTKFRKGKKIVKEIVDTGKTINDVYQLINSPVGKIVTDTAKNSLAL
jgi:hypothetical protein